VSAWRHIVELENGLMMADERLLDKAFGSEFCKWVAAAFGVRANLEFSLAKWHRKVAAGMGKRVGTESNLGLFAAVQDIE